MGHSGLRTGKTERKFTAQVIFQHHGAVQPHTAIYWLARAPSRPQTTRTACHCALKSSQQNQTTLLRLTVTVKLDSTFIKLCVCVKKIKLPALGIKNGFSRSSHIYTIFTWDVAEIYSLFLQSVLSYSTVVLLLYCKLGIMEVSTFSQKNMNQKPEWPILPRCFMAPWQYWVGIESSPKVSPEWPKIFKWVAMEF